MGEYKLVPVDLLLDLKRKRGARPMPKQSLRKVDIDWKKKSP